MTSRSSLGVWLISMAMVAVAFMLIAAVPEGRAPAGATVGDILPILPLPLSAASVGALIGWQRPGNRVGRLLSMLGVLAGLQFLTVGYAIFGSFSDHPLPFANIAAWIFSWSGATIGLFAYRILFEFPDGPHERRRARLGFACGVGSTIAFWIGIAILPGTLFNMSGIQNPFGNTEAGPLVVALLIAAGLSFLATVIFAASSLAEGYRRSERRERLQLKWFLAGLIFAVAGAAISLALALVDFRIAKIGMTLAVSAIPVAIAIAILREHLYDIDVVINRALVYGATTAGIAVAFFTGIVVLQTILRPFTNGSEIAVAASTLASVALAQPLRARMQDAVDRRFYRSRYNAVRTLDAFSARLRDQVDLDAVRADLVDAVRETMQPVHASVWLRTQ